VELKDFKKLTIGQEIYFKGGIVKIEALDIVSYYITFREYRISEGAHLFKQIMHELSFEKPKEKVAYYKWRLWSNNGDIHETSFLLDDNGNYGEGNVCNDFTDAIYKEKISEAVYKVEGQK